METDKPQEAPSLLSRGKSFFAKLAGNSTSTPNNSDRSLSASNVSLSSQSQTAITSLDSDKVEHILQVIRDDDDADLGSAFEKLSLADKAEKGDGKGEAEFIRQLRTKAEIIIGAKDNLSNLSEIAPSPAGAVAKPEIIIGVKDNLDNLCDAILSPARALAKPGIAADIVSETVRVFVGPAQTQFGVVLERNRDSSSASGTSSSASSSGALSEDDSPWEETMDSPFSVPRFAGTRNEDAVDWLLQLTHCLNTRKGFDDVQKISFARLHLQDAALNWFDKLSQGREDGSGGSMEGQRNIRTWHDFTRAFTEKFQMDDAAKRRQAISLGAIKQGGTETSEDYFKKLWRQSRSVQMSDEQMLTIAIAGLRPEVQRAVLAKDPKDMNDLQRYASDFEAYSDNSISVEYLRKLECRMEAVQKAIETPKISAVGQFRESSPTGASRARSPTPLRARFQDEDKTPDRRPGDDRTPAPTRGRWDDRTNHDERSYNRNRDFSRNYGQDRNRCGSCGLDGHYGRQCPAIGRECHACGLKNHFQRVCRSRNSDRGNRSNNTQRGGYRGSNPGYRYQNWGPPPPPPPNRA